MRLLILVVLLLPIGAISSTCMAETYTQKTGPFTIQETSDQAVVLDNVVDPYPLDNFNAYDVDLHVGGHPCEIEIQDYGQSINIDLTSSILKYNPPWNEFFTSWETSEVGGKPGVIGIREKGGTNKNGITEPRGFTAAYSPNGYGNQGTIVAIIDATSINEKNFQIDKTEFENFVRDIQIIKTG